MLPQLHASSHAATDPKLRTEWHLTLVKAATLFSPNVSDIAPMIITFFDSGNHWRESSS